MDMPCESDLWYVRVRHVFETFKFRDTVHIIRSLSLLMAKVGLKKAGLKDISPGTPVLYLLCPPGIIVRFVVVKCEGLDYSYA